MRIIVIALVFFAAAVFGLIYHLNSAAKFTHRPNPVVEAEPPVAAPTIGEQQAPPPPGVSSSATTTEQVPASSSDETLPLAEQLALQTEWLRSIAVVPTRDADFVAADDVAGDVPPLPIAQSYAIDERGELLVHEHEEDTRVVRRWNPFTGEPTAVLMLEGFEIARGLVGKTGLFFLVRAVSDVYTNADFMVFVDESGNATMAPLWSVRNDPEVVLLPDESIIVIGGRDTVSGGPVKTVERATISRGRLEIEALHDYFGPLRHDYAVVAMADSKLMMLGGNIEKHGSCPHRACTNKTYILNPKSGLWDIGPDLLRPRAAMTASLLADGSILVAGGWEVDPSGNARRSDTSERFLPDEFRFDRAARLPVAMAGHRALRLTDDDSSPLLLLDPHSSSMLTYDSELESFRVVGGYSSLVSFELGPFSDGQRHFFWVSGNSGGGWSRQRIRIGDHPPDQGIPSSRTVNLYRTAGTFLPGENGDPGLVIGGYVPDFDEPVAAVDSYAVQTGLQAFTSLPVGRAGFEAFRLSNGAVVVAGGTGPYFEHEIDNEEARALPLLVLPRVAAHGKWHSVAVDHPLDTRYAQLDREGLVAIFDGDAVEYLDIVFKEPFPPEVRTTSLPKLPVYRSNRGQRGSNMVTRRLNDGRLIVAGGIVHEKRIAVIRESPDEPQRYVGRGALVPADTYEIYDPAERRWNTSEPSSKRGGQVEIADDGRVLKLYLDTRPDGSGHDESLKIEVSRADGRGWSMLDAVRPPRIRADGARLIALDSEIFLAGYSLDAGDGPHERILQWFNAAAREWVTVWTAENTDPDFRQDVLAIVDIADRRHLLVPISGS